MCDTVAKADANSAENIRQKVTPSPSHDKSNGLLAHSDEAKSRLDLFKGDDESYNDVIIRLTSHDKWAGFGIASSMDNEGMDEIREQMRSRMDDHIEELEQ
ncbi:sugar metabolism cluster protein [Natrinema gari JCM 14663]|uniref:Sugar metabolism cluster protein n=1 Tax=Natrinema gari JCM 14663 TaxID=1230459 RepID=L9YTN1_9EURY|nr:sugar metabolism cluster protein [Natrinema gari JCM 14663]